LSRRWEGLEENYFRGVESWLYSIPRLEVALESLKLELERLDTKIESPPRWASNPQGTPITGGDLDSRLDKWGEFIDEYPVRRQEILQKIEDREHQLANFERVMELLRSENLQLAQLVRKKYIEKIKPDEEIWVNHLFISKASFYRMRAYIVGIFYECLPGEFIKADRQAS
jgi:hypothetical protein